MAEKSRYWTFIVYPDSAPQNWRQLLEETHVSMFISPFHENDLTEMGEKKKPHYHVLVCWDGPTTEKNVSNIFGCSAANGVIQQVASARGMYRYLTHLDNPDKFQYSPDDIIALNGANAANLLSETDKNNIMYDIGQLIIDYDIREYAELVTYLYMEGMRDYLAVLQHNTTHFNAFLKSRKYSLDKKDIADGRKIRNKINPLTDAYMSRRMKEAEDNGQKGKACAEKKSHNIH